MFEQPKPLEIKAMHKPPSPGMDGMDAYLARPKQSSKTGCLVIYSVVILAIVFGVAKWSASSPVTPSSSKPAPIYSIVSIRTVNSHVERWRIRITVMPNLTEAAMDLALEAASKEWLQSHPRAGAIQAFAAYSNEPSKNVWTGIYAPGGDWTKAGSSEPWSYTSQGKAYGEN